MKKVLLSIAALFTVATYASAQETGFGFGPKVGINLSNQTLLDGDYKTGLTAGVFADYRFSNLFALSADVLYSRQGTKGEGVKVKTDNLNIPILANFYLVKGLAVKAGIQPGFLLKAKNNDVDVKAAYKKADVAVPVGVSYLFNCGLILDARYNIGLTSLAKDKDIVPPVGDFNRDRDRQTPGYDRSGFKKTGRLSFERRPVSHVAFR